MARLAQIDRPSLNISAQIESTQASTNWEVSIRKLSLKGALQLVAKGQMEASDLHSQVPGEIGKVFDQISRLLHQMSFTELDSARQRGVCDLLLAALPD